VGTAHLAELLLLQVMLPLKVVGALLLLIFTWIEHKVSDIKMALEVL